MNQKIVFFIILSIVWGISGVTLASSKNEENHWARTIIDSFVENGYVKNNEEEFDADTFISAGEIAFIMNRVFLLGNYDDFQENLEKIQEQGYMLNYTVSDTIPRQEVAIIVSQILNLEVESSTTSFEDDSQIAEWTKKYVSALQKKKIVIGYPDLCFKPNRKITKAELITIVSRCKSVNGQDLTIIENGKNVSNLEVGIFKYENGKVVVSPINDELKMKSGDVVELAITMPEDSSDNLLRIEVTKRDVIDVEEETLTVKANKPGITFLTIFTSKGEEKKIQITVTE